MTDRRCLCRYPGRLIAAWVTVLALIVEPASVWAGRGDDPLFAEDQLPAKTEDREPTSDPAMTNGDTGFLPPPRTISDITAILDQERRTDEASLAEARNLVAKPPPKGADAGALAQFHFDRARAAHLLGRAKLELADYRAAVEHARNSRRVPLHLVLLDLGLAEVRGGNFSRGLAAIEEAPEHEPPTADMEAHFVFLGHVAMYYLLLADLYSFAGDLEIAQDAQDRGQGYWSSVFKMMNHPKSGVGGREIITAYMNANVATGQASILEAQGILDDAEVLRRKAIEIFSPVKDSPLTWQIDQKNSARVHTHLVQLLAENLRRQGRLIEAEVEARKALLGSLQAYGRDAAHTADVLRTLVRILFEQGRYADAETLARANLDIYDRTGVAPDSLLLAQARSALGDSLVAQGSWRAALATYEQIELALAEDRLLFERTLAANVNWALAASSARAAARDPELAELVRRAQDSEKQISAIYGLLAEIGARPSDGQDPKTIAALQQRIAVRRASLAELADRIEQGFPDYAALVNPKPSTIAEVQADLQAGEALIAVLLGNNRSHVWAVPHRGDVVFAAVPRDTADIIADVSILRAALDPGARTLGQIPAFDLATAYRLYETLLASIEAGWRDAESLLIIPHGPLGYLPLSVLPTAPARQAPDAGFPLAGYRQIPWLARSHAITVLPSVASLKTLRALPSSDPSRRSFVGFGDPYFSLAQATAAEEPGNGSAATRGAGQRRAATPLSLCDVSDTRGLDSASLARLPRLPDTGIEVGSIACALQANPTRDVFLGRDANEARVKEMDLSQYRVLAFATHGLVPGDLDGLTQPALALTAPEVADVDGDGLLTMGEILALRLNADWVVLSACNTGAGEGAGAEAVSGLGRAFFYAGARALLVSNWPVHSASAKELTTDLFRRQASDPALSRAQALCQAMIALMDGPGYSDPASGEPLFSYAHPMFWAPFTVVGDGG